MFGNSKYILQNVYHIRFQKYKIMLAFEVVL